MSSKTDCRGVVFQFNAKAVLFEFMHEGKEAIGTVDPSKISLDDGGTKIPVGDGADADEVVAKHLQVGDEVVCSVVEKADLPKFVYEEEEEEVTEFGDVLNRKNKVEILPEWLAEEAVLVARLKLAPTETNGNNGEVAQKKEEKEDEKEAEKVKEDEPNDKVKEEEKKEMEDEVEDFVELEVQDDDIFDYDPEEEVDNSKVDVKKKEEPPSSKSKETKRRSSSPRDEKGSKSDSKSSDVAVLKATAKIVSLKPPVSKSGRQKVKITSGIMEIVDGGPLNGRRAHFQAHVLNFWGQSMGRADLSYYIKAGDEFRVKMTEDNSGALQVKRAAMGDDDAPKDPAKCQELINWLANRGMELTLFKKWQNDGLPRKYYFPLVTEVREGKLVRLLTDKGQVLGGLVEVPSQVLPPGADEEDSAAVEEGDLVVFERDDFYAHEVWVGCVDLRMLLRKGDKLSVMVSDLGARKMAGLKCALSLEEQERVSTASLAFLGPKRPRNANMKPNESVGLKEFLSSVGMSVEEVAEKTAASENGTSSRSSKDSKRDIVSPSRVGINPWVTANPGAAQQSGQGQDLPAAALAHPGISLVSRAIKVASAEDPLVRYIAKVSYLLVSFCLVQLVIVVGLKQQPLFKIST